MKALREAVQKLLQNETELFETKLQKLCDLLQSTLPHYTWVGFYFANSEQKTLHLGPYAGSTTDHTCIPFGKGICGQVAESNDYFLVPDVKAQDNYIACSLSVKSELVVPLFVQDKNIGQIDIDSDQIEAFSEQDVHFLQWVNSQIAQVWPQGYIPKVIHA